MKRLRNITVFCFALLLFSIVMILIFPRGTHPAAGVFFAVVFWLSAIAAVFFGYTYYRNMKKRILLREKRRSAATHGSAETHGHTGGFARSFADASADKEFVRAYMKAKNTSEF